MGNACSGGGANTSGSEAQLGISASTIEDIKTSIKSTIEKHTNVENTFIRSGQSIIVRQTGDFNENAKMYNRPIKKKFLGLVEYKDCGYQYGCAYSINQTADVNIASFNESITNESEQIYNDIKTSLEKSTDMELSGGNKGLAAIAAEMDRSKEDIQKNLEKVLNTLKTNQIEEDQEMVVEYRTPAKCEDPCGDDTNNPRGPGPRGPLLEQNAQIDIISDQLVTSTLETISERLSEKDLKAATEISDFNPQCIISLLICSGIIFGVGVGLYTISKMIGGGGDKKPDMGDMAQAMPQSDQSQPEAPQDTSQETSQDTSHDDGERGESRSGRSRPRSRSRRGRRRRRG